VRLAREVLVVPVRRIAEVRAPGAGVEVVRLGLTGGAPVDVSVRLDRLQGDRDPQHLLPATLQVFADGGVPGRRVLVHDRDVDGRRVDARVGQQLDGLLIALGKRRVRVVTRDV